MTSLELATRFMEIFYSGEPPENLKKICSQDMTFEGPMYQLSNLEDYIQSLNESPPDGMQYQILKSYEDENSACLIYIFERGTIETVMSQLFIIKEGKINHIQLIFDSHQFVLPV